MAPQPTAVLERLIEDDYLHEQLSAGADRLLAAYRRGRSMRAHEAAQDEKLFEHVRASAASVVAAGRRLAGKPEPEPRRRRTVPVLVIGLAVLALVRSMHRAQRERA
jgi:hypothetical protein